MLKNTNESILYVNRHSSRSEQLLDVALPILQREIPKLRVEDRSSPQNLRAAVEDLGDTLERIIVAGGDGTLNRVADVLLDADRPVGILPTGTANDLAHTLGLPDDVEQVCHTILEGHTRHIDVASVDGHNYFNVASIGFGAEVSQSLTTSNKRMLGMGAYFLSVIRGLRAYNPFIATIDWEGGSKQMRCTHLAVGNGRFYAGVVVSDKAAVDDGVLDLSAIRGPLWRLLMSPIRAYQGEWERTKGTLHVQSPYFDIRTDRQMRISADGEELSSTPATFRVASRRLLVYAPRANQKKQDNPTRNTFI